MPLALFLADVLPRKSFQFSTDQLVVGLIASVVSALCVLFHYEVMNWTSRMLPRLPLPKRARIVTLILAMLVAHVVEVWFFGLTYWILDRWPSLGTLVGTLDGGALDYIYYSVTIFTTMGFGDIVPQGPMRILTGAESLLGLSLITWSASLAFLEMQRDWREFRSMR